MQDQGMRYMDAYMLHVSEHAAFSYSMYNCEFLYRSHHVRMTIPILDADNVQHFWFQMANAT